MRHLPRLSLSRWGALIIALMISATALAADGDRPHDVAVRNGDVVATSLGSNSVSVVLDGDMTPTHINLGAPTWGVCFAGDKAYITMPSEESIAVLDFSGGGIPTVGPSLSVPRGCTEIIADQAGGMLYVANVGISPSSFKADGWQHAVLKINLPSGSYTMFATERQPRALTLSPDEARLFVGTAQGALGDEGLLPSYTQNGFTDTYDGGSLLIYDTAFGDLEYRIAVGSPVRGLTALAGADYATINPGDYRIYFTHVGEGVQSEDPAHGGLVIPNVISSIRLSATHIPEERQDTIFRHDPAFEPAPDAPNADLPAVLPEKIAVRSTSARTGFEAEIWVTNSASGTVSRAWVNSGSGAIATVGNDLQLIFPAVDTVNPGTFGFNFTDHTKNYGRVSPNDHIRTDDELGVNFAFRSRPRGIAYDALHDQFIVCTESNGELAIIDASQSSFTTTIATTIPVGQRIARYDRGTTGEGNFFTFGEGFDFREGSAAKVNNISCGTCHVDGHIDGKVRLTVRVSDNLAGGAENRMVTAVPSVRDGFNTEWLFFEGLKTVADRVAVRPGCTYCLANEFFTDTVNFRPTSTSSPHVGGASSLPAAAEAGRAWFDDMNCTRCHAGSSDSFLRTRDTRFTNGTLGPLAFNGNVLSDPTQSFISFSGVVNIDDQNSLRNMTNVGTRTWDPVASINPAGNARIRGINTPSLAGVWDNRPYMHDGRYRTIDEVLEHTWVKNDLGARAARVWNGAGLVDNLLDDESRPITDTSLPAMKVRESGDVFVDRQQVPQHNFMTHADADPDGAGTEWVSVKDHLLANNSYGDVLEFLKALSRDLDPFPVATSAITNLAVTPGSGAEALVTWQTPEVMVSRIVATNDNNTDVYSDNTEPGTSHSATVPLSAMANWTAEITTSYNGNVVSDSVQWSNVVPVYSPEIQVAHGGQDVIVSWTTAIPATGHLEWAPSDFSEPAEELNTPFGTEHSFVIPDAAGTHWITLARADAYGSLSIESPNINFSTVTFSTIAITTDPFCESTISWTTDIPVPCQVDWGPASDPYPINTNYTGTSTNHSVAVDVTPGVMYRVVVWVPEAYGIEWYGGGERTWVAKRCVLELKLASETIEGGFSIAPNPFNPQTEIKYSLPVAGHVEMQIFDVRGHLVRKLVSSQQAAGTHAITWTGRDDQGAAVASGVYFLRLVSGEINHSAKLLLLE